MKIKKILILSCFVILFAGCKMIELKMMNIIYKPNVEKQGYSMFIPSTKLIGYIEGEGEYCYNFYYKYDTLNTIVYISYSGMNFNSDINAENIQNQYGDSIYNIRFEGDPDDLNHIQQLLYGKKDSSQYIPQLPDTLILEGNDGVYCWKDIKIKRKINVGYINIPIEKKEIFDQCLSSLSLLSDSSIIQDPLVVKFKKDEKNFIKKTNKTYNIKK